MKTKVHIGSQGLTIETENMLITIEARQLPELMVDGHRQPLPACPGEWERHITPQVDQDPAVSRKTPKTPEPKSPKAPIETAGKGELNCASCGKLFVPKMANSRFCSKPCAQKHYMAVWAAKKTQKKAKKDTPGDRFYDPRIDPMTGKRAQEK